MADQSSINSLQELSGLAKNSSKTDKSCIPTRLISPGYNINDDINDNVFEATVENAAFGGGASAVNHDRVPEVIPDVYNILLQNQILMQNMMKKQMFSTTDSSNNVNKNNSRKSATISMTPAPVVKKHNKHHDDYQSQLDKLFAVNNNKSEQSEQLYSDISSAESNDESVYDSDDDCSGDEELAENTSKKNDNVNVLESMKDFIRFQPKFRGITNDIVYWKSNNWKLKSSGNDVKNKELWSEIDHLLSNIKVTWAHVARDSEIGQIEADKLAKLALNIKTSGNTVQANNNSIVNVCNNIDRTDDEEETIPMKVTTPRRKMKDKFASLTNTVKVQTNSALTSVQEVFTQTQLIKSDIDVNNKAFINKSNSLWDKLNAVSNEIKSVNLKSSHVNDLTKTVTETPNRKREERISASNKPTPGTYSNAENVNSTNQYQSKDYPGGRIRDIEDCLIQYISEGRLDCVDVIVIHVGTNNVSDGDSVHAIMDDFKNLICTVRQSLPRTKLVISSILPRPTNSQANRTIYNVNNHLFSLEEQHVEILDNTLDFLYGDQPNLTLFADHVHTNVAGAKVLSHNIISCVNNLFQFSNCTSETESNFQSVRSTGRRFIPFNNTQQLKNKVCPVKRTGGKFNQ
ncbi:Hypothetical predicted protein [Mytilus galloprovincialis]|uniref:RNase H type-1 domain-containing protein n=1 Tax=Mytilus galloprovincialis TaxID=29158 RepID=A0A8B6D279_MYTGA|nr:Hypothetical predicted protein [Mytilus galloprovincialis]